MTNTEHPIDEQGVPAEILAELDNLPVCYAKLAALKTAAAHEPNKPVQGTTILGTLVMRLPLSSLRAETRRAVAAHVPLAETPPVEGLEISWSPNPDNKKMVVFRFAQGDGKFSVTGLPSVCVLKFVQEAKQNNAVLAYILDHAPARLLDYLVYHFVVQEGKSGQTNVPSANVPATEYLRRT